MESNMQGTRTEANLIKFWRAKSAAKMKFTMFQQTAGRENPSYRQLATLLEEYATHSYVHAAHFHKVLWGPYTDVEKNLEAIIAQEQEFATGSLIEYAKTAREEGFMDIAATLELMAKVDGEQARKFTEILEKLRNDTIFNKPEEQDWYCLQCGHVHRAKSAPENCPLCKAAKRFFELKGANFSTF